MKIKGVAGVILLSMIFAGCKSSRVNEKELAAAQRIGEQASLELMKTLKSQLQQAIQDSGTAYAIKFCNNTALPLTKKVQYQQPDGVSIKRTSSRYRNASNAPDPLEEEVLATLAEVYESGETPSEHVMRTTREDGKWTYHYFKPMVVAELCTNCHGVRAAMDSAVVDILDKRYPDDRAVGYAPGDFRGVIHVAIQQKAVRDR